MSVQSATKLRLISIGPDGAPTEPVVELTDVAREACASTAALYANVGFVPPWIGYLGIVRNDVIGTCAFKAPMQGQRVEIAYFTFPEFEGRGYATRMARALVHVAAAASPGVLVVAQTLPEDNPSTSVLRRLGFELDGPLEHPDDGLVWEWHLATGDVLED